jgi:calcineurin-like phosphoesterase family protein
MSAVLIISDLHFQHRNICKYRPEFSSVEEHDGVILDNIKSAGNKRNQLWMLGDCFFNWQAFGYLEEIVKYYECVNFVPGNHDTDNRERIDILKESIRRGYYSKVGSMFKQSGFWLTHPPIHPDELRGCVNIHGHVHNQTVRHPGFINVSCENVRYKPVNMQHLKEERFREKLLVEYGYED